MPSVINTSVKGVSIERSTLGNQLTILKLKDQVKMLKEETHQLTQLNFKLCDENEMLQEENQSLGGTGAIEKNELLSTNIMQGSMPGAPHRFESPNARVKYFEKRNAHNKASLKVKSIMNQTVLQAERREYKESIKDIMEKSQQEIEQLRQTLCKENDDTLEMLAQSTRKLVQLEQQKNILMANLAFVKEQFQKFASSQTKKPIKKPSLLSQNRLSPTGIAQNNQGQEQDDDDQDQDPELVIEQLKGKIKQLQLDKDELQQQSKDKDKQLQEKNKTILEYQNKYNEIDIDILHEQINHLKSQNEILQKQKKLLQNPSKEQQQQEQGEEEQDVNPQEEKIKQPAGQLELKEAGRAKELAAKYMEK